MFLGQPDLKAHLLTRMSDPASTPSKKNSRTWSARSVELSDVVARQQKELDRALERNQRLVEKLAAIESDFGPSATAHEKPPHY